MATPVTLYDLLPDVLGRIEEALPANYNNPPYAPNPPGSPAGPIHWSLEGEVYVKMVDALFEAALSIGVIQVPDVLVTLTAGDTYFALQNNTGIGIPVGAIAALRMRAPYQIRKTSLKALDDTDPTWQTQATAGQIRAWFPLGTSYFGIYPALSAETQVLMDFIVCPINQARPYDGTQVSPFQNEFNDLISQYAAATLRLKEGGAEAEEGDVVYQTFLTRMKELSAFQQRIDSLVYSRAFGAQTRVDDREVV